ncbi:MAG: hypothetical protein WDN66_03645 [Candidatus Saccharibacteria bacterium]
MNAQQLYDDIIRYIGVDKFSSWYVGVTSNIEQRLFMAHNVHRTNHRWIHGQAINSGHARSVESALMQLGLDGGSGGGDHTAVHVYAFRKDYGTIR